MTIMRNAQVDHHAPTDDHRPHVPPDLVATGQAEPGGAATSVATAPSLARAPHPWTARHDQLIATAPARLDVRLTNRSRT